MNNRIKRKIPSMIILLFSFLLFTVNNVTANDESKNIDSIENNISKLLNNHISYEEKQKKEFEERIKKRSILRRCTGKSFIINFHCISPGRKMEDPILEDAIFLNDTLYFSGKFVGNCCPGEKWYTNTSNDTIKICIPQSASGCGCICTMKFDAFIPGFKKGKYKLMIPLLGLEKENVICDF